MSNPSANNPTPLMEGPFCFIRGQKVMLDADLADLHQVSTKALNLAVRRNRNRFPEDFMFQLTADEAARLHPHLDAGGRPVEQTGEQPTLPYAFTDFGIAMLSLVLNGKLAIELSLAMMREVVQSGELSWDNITAALSAEPPKKRAGSFMQRAGAVNEY